VIVDAVVRRGVTPLPQAIVGDIAPDHRIADVPVGGEALLDPVEKKLAVAPVPPVPAGKSMLATGLTVVGPVPETPHPPLERATLTRVYPA
jgi:hypothetical protein